MNFNSFLESSNIDAYFLIIIISRVRSELKVDEKDQMKSERRVVTNNKN
jgi:hypothetical protein